MFGAGAARGGVPRQLSFGLPHTSSRPHRIPTLTMVLEAVQALNNPKGVSAFAIKRYILHEYPGVDSVRLKYYLKQALVKGINQGYLVRPPKSSAQGASGSFKLGKTKAQQGPGRRKKPSDEKTAAKPAGEAAKKPKAKEPQQKPKLKGAEQVKKKGSSTKPAVASGDGGAVASGAKPKAKAPGVKATKTTKQQGVPKSSQAKPAASGMKKGAPKTKAKLKGVPETKTKPKPPQSEKAKADAVPKGAIPRSRALTEMKASSDEAKPKAKKGATGAQKKIKGLEA